MTIEDLENKFNSLAVVKFKDAELQHLKEIIFNCDQYSTKTFMKELIAR